MIYSYVGRAWAAVHRSLPYDHLHRVPENEKAFSLWAGIMAIMANHWVTVSDRPQTRRLRS
jgi:hypothetical protein